MTIKSSEIKDIIEHLKELSAQDFQNFGRHQIAYLHTRVEKGKTLHVISSADGQEIATAKSKELAIVIAKQNDLDPVMCQ